MSRIRRLRRMSSRSSVTPNTRSLGELIAESEDGDEQKVRKTSDHSVVHICGKSTHFHRFLKQA